MQSQPESNPSIGISLAKPASLTPGMAANLLRISFCVRATPCASGINRSGIEIRINCKCPASVKPGSTVPNASNVRIISPAQISSTKAMATWPTTSRFRARCRSRLTLMLLPALRSSSAVLGPAYFNAGISPKNSPDSAEIRKAKASVRESIEISLKRGRFAGPIAARKRTPA